MSAPDQPTHFRRSDLDPDPLVEFGRWFERAQSAGLIEPTAASLATASEEGRPSCRMVLLKGFDERGFVFYTNYRSRKAVELAANPHASLSFWWDKLQQQVRIEGSVEKASASESDAYFASRPLGSRLGAWASEQSQVLADRSELERKLRDTEERFGAEVPRPDHWGGYRLRPESIEFWQGQASRLHDRFRYRRTSEGADGWLIERLSP